VNGNPSIGLAGSIPPAAAFEHPMRELVHMIALSGFTPTSADLYQLLKAIRSQAVNYVIDVGTVNNLSVAFNPALDGYTNGLIVRVKVGHTNTGPSQIDCGPGFRPIVCIDGSPLAPGDIWAAGVATLCYVDTEFQLLTPNVAAMIASIPPGGGPGVSGGVTGGTTYNTYVYNAFQGIVAWMAPGTYDWTVPGGVQHVWGRLWAGGGPGYFFYRRPGYPGTNWPPMKGGDGGYVEGRFNTVPGTLMRVVIGAGCPPPVTPGEEWDFDQTAWGNAYGGSSSFSVAGGAVLCSATGGRGCIPISAPSEYGDGLQPGQPGTGTGGTVNIANGIYGRGGYDGQPWNGTDDYLQSMATGGNGACILMY
jgi:hypothetical protein